MVQLNEKQKYEIIIKHELKHTILQISTDMKINRKTVMKWINKYKKDKTVNRQIGSGRKRKTSKREDNEISKLMKQNKFYTSGEIKIILSEKNINVSEDTIIRRLHEMNYSYKNPIKKPLMSINAINNRYLWATENQKTEWENVIFSDESSISIGFTGKRWVFMDEDDFEYVVKHSIKIHVWGYISLVLGTKIFLFTENLTAELYLNILKDNLLDDYNNKRDLIFQNDNDPKHTSKIVENWKNSNNIKCLDWPSYSPDLNPIENII